MRKLITLIAAVLMIASMLTACGENSAENPATDDESPFQEPVFVTIEEHWGYSLLYCKETGVMYWMSQGSYNVGVLTLLVNPDGSPMIYQGDK